MGLWSLRPKGQVDTRTLALGLTQNKKIAVFVSFSGQGGVERMITNLCNGFADLGHQVDLVVPKKKRTILHDLPASINLVQLNASSTLASLPALIRYIREKRPDAILAAKDRANQVAILARRLSGVESRLGVRMGTTVSASLHGRSRIKKWWWKLLIRKTYPMADAIIAVSRGVAEDLAEITGIPIDHFKVIPNPVVSENLYSMAREEVDHKWFRNEGPPVIIASGRLTRQKDFPTLIKAFKLIREKMAARLVILGEGRDREKLERLAETLSIKEDLYLPGFVANPYKYISRASLFALSSAWEGSPNVLTEALAIGVPVVATDCPSGPREILKDGVYGPIVPVEDAHALAQAIVDTLKTPLNSAFLKKAVEDYTIKNSSRLYLQAMLGLQ